jgi:NAD(P)-dependent dehydrogenase (short-subunit alcohol dehydrogenase family)
VAQRKVLITGAGSGLGRALAERHARRGDVVACVDRNRASADAACAALDGAGHLAFEADVGSDDSMQALADDVRAVWGGVERLYNNAGIASGGAMVETTMAEWRQVLDIDLLGVVRGCRLFLPAMLAAGRGHIVNTASFAGLAGAPGIMTYGVAKAGVVALSEQLRAEVEPKGVRVSVLCPSFFRTNLMDGALGSDRVKSLALRMMDKSPDTLDAVADTVLAQVDAGRFLVLPTQREPMRWRLKRWFPEFYFRQILKAYAALDRKP